jgi:predicted RNA-binding Zn ribbon-like protein
MPEVSTGYWLSTRSGRRFAFDAGALCLEFATTGGEGWRKAWETLHEPADLAAWAGRSRLGTAGRIDPADVRLGPSDLTAAGLLREAIWAAGTDLALGRRPRGEDLTTINNAAAAPPMTPVIDLAGPNRSWATPITGPALLSTVARDAIEVLTGPMAPKIRQCASQNCALIFVDTSPPGRRRWCSMERCGNIDKQRALRTRQRPAGRPPGIT